MMKTPDKIKKGLEIAINGCLPCDRPITDCPYDLECRPTSKDTNIDIPKQMAADAIDYIQQLENHIGELTEKVTQLEAAQPRWISVNERLPEEGVWVLTREKYGKIRNRSLHVLSDGTNRFWPDRLFAGEHITHWMPLPEAPEEG